MIKAVIRKLIKERFNIPLIGTHPRLIQLNIFLNQYQPQPHILDFFVLNTQARPLYPA